MGDDRVNEYYIEMVNIKKKFGNVTALDGCNLSVKKGEVTAIVGDNGSGKSTLIKILNGNISPDEGEIYIDGKHYQDLNIKKALELGIETVYQDLSIDNYKNSSENIFLGCEILKNGIFLDKKRMKEEARRLLDELNINIKDLDEPVLNLSGGQRQGVAIAKALYKKSNIIIMDEPTAAMGIKETHKIMNTLKNLKNNNNQITQIIICHNLFQAFEIADTIHIIKSGKCIKKIETKSSSPMEVNKIMMELELGEE